MLAGTELRKERRLSEILTDSINILFVHWRPLAVISLPLVIANIAFSLVLLAVSQDLPTTQEITDETVDLTTDEAIRILTALGLVLVVGLPVLFVFQQLVSGGTIAYLDESDRVISRYRCNRSEADGENPKCW